MTGSGPLPVPYWESVYLHNSFSQCPLSPLSVPHEVPVSSKFIRRRIEDLERAERDPCRFPNRKCYGDFWREGDYRVTVLLTKAKKQALYTLTLLQQSIHPSSAWMLGRMQDWTAASPPPRPILCLGVWPCEGCPLSLRASLQCSFLP